MSKVQAQAETSSGEPEVDHLPRGSLRSSFGFKLRRLQLAYKWHFNRLAAGTDLQLNHVGPMSLIASNPGVTPTALATALTTDAAQITGILNALELKGLISRQKAKSDSRSRSLRLTPLGKRKHDQLQGVVAEVERTFVGDVLSREECHELLRLLDCLQQAPQNNR
jgi:DNA-binding MarR family transcriptional regulator